MLAGALVMLMSIDVLLYEMEANWNTNGKTQIFVNLNGPEVIKPYMQKRYGSGQLHPVNVILQ